MKITVSQLRRIIREEVERNLHKSSSPPSLSDLRREFELGDSDGTPIDDLAEKLNMTRENFLETFKNDIELDGEYVVATSVPENFVSNYKGGPSAY